MPKLIPSKNTPDKDRVYTPKILAEKLVKYFIPADRAIIALEPCRGLDSKSFYDALYNHLDLEICGLDWCEIEEGRDFFDYKGSVDFTVTNPPFSLMRKFLKKSMEVSKNVIFLCPINHILGLKARLRDIDQAGFYIREILMVDTPKEFPNSGFQYAAIHLRKIPGDCKIGHLKNTVIDIFWEDLK